MAVVKNRNRTRVDTRIGVLSTAVGEYAKAFGADNDCLASIKKGIRERQIIEKINLLYYSHKKYVGHISMKIDWERHQVLVDSENGNEFRLAADKSILEQLDAASQEIIRHVERMKKECSVTRVESNYIYRYEYRSDEQKHDEARKFLGHVPSGERKKTDQTEEFKTYIRFVMDKLEELEIIVES